MESDTCHVTEILSKTQKYKLHYYGKQVYKGNNYHSFVVFQSIRNYWQQVESGVNFSDKVMQEYLDELV